MSKDEVEELIDDRKDSGNYIPHKDFKNVKTRFLYKYGWKEKIIWE